MQRVAHSCLLRFEAGSVSSCAGVSGATSASCRKAILIPMLKALIQQPTFHSHHEHAFWYADARCLHVLLRPAAAWQDSRPYTALGRLEEHAKSTEEFFCLLSPHYLRGPACRVDESRQPSPAPATVPH